MAAIRAPDAAPNAPSTFFPHPPNPATASAIGLSIMFLVFLPYYVLRAGLAADNVVELLAIPATGVDHQVAVRANHVVVERIMVRPDDHAVNRGK